MPRSIIWRGTRRLAAVRPTKNRWLALPVAAAAAASLAVAVAGPAAADTSSSCPWVGSSAAADVKAAAVVSLMTRDEKLSLVHGASGWTYNTDGYTGIIPAVQRLCLPRMTMKDGPNGLRLTGTTLLPTGEVLASSWDPSLAQSYGAVLGQESRTTGVDVLLGPTVNLVRDSRWGRADETYGEDPLLAGQMGTGTVQGIQSAGVIAELKHYAAYNQETNRQAPADTVVASDRTMHELYTRQFADIVKNAKPGAIMCSYNRVDPYFTNPDGTRTSIGPTQSACSSSYLSNILHQQNGFQGWVGTDWNAAYRGTTLDSVSAGLNIQTPGDDSDVYNSALAAAVAKGYVTDAQLSGLVRPIVRSEFQFGLVDSPKTGTVTTPSSTPEHQAAALKIAQNGTVLLKNTDHVLPLASSSVGSIAMFGDDTLVRNSGTTPGSSGAPLAHTAIVARAGSGVTTSYDPSATPTAGTAAAAAAANVAIVFVNKVQNEGRDATDLSLPSNENDLVAAVAAANPNTVVVMNTSAAVLMPWLGQVKGVMEAWLGGEQGGNALASLVFGDVNPSGKLPLTFPASIEQSPTSTVAQWPGDGTTVDYSEGLDMGYRWFNANGVAPVFPFGYGLSYSSFQFSNLKLSQPYGTSDANVQVSFTVRNTGSVAGSDVGQVYLTKPNTLATSPPNQLVGFKKVTLAPGTSTKVSVTVPAEQLGYWDGGAQAWTVQDGNYQFAVGDSSASLPLTAGYDVTSTTGPVRLVLGAAPTTVATGTTFPLTATASNLSDLPVKNGSLTLTGPKGWTAAPSSAAASPAIGASLARTFRITAPTTATPGNNRVSMTLTGLVGGKPFSVTQAVTVVVPFRTLAAATTVVGTTTAATRDAGNFDGRGDSYSAEALAANGFAPGATVRFPDGGTATFPASAPGTYNAITAGGQTIALSGRGTALTLVGASTRGAATGTVTVTYTDGTTSTGTLSLGDWSVTTPPAGAVALTTVPWNQRSTTTTPVARQVTLFGQEVPITAGKTVASVTLPNLSSVQLFNVGITAALGV